jgi:tellurite resistance protein
VATLNGRATPAAGRKQKKRLRNRAFLQALMPGCRSTVLSSAKKLMSEG